MSIRAKGAFEPIIDRSLFDGPWGKHPRAATLFLKSVVTAPGKYSPF
jgi:hypothetical protein